MSHSPQQAPHAHNLAHPAAHSDVPFPHGAGYAARQSLQARGLMRPSDPNALLKAKCSAAAIVSSVVIMIVCDSITIRMKLAATDGR
eukprot:COSAG06_NODE_3078_length_5888_cov_24.975643_2_plen_87_part_00